MGQLIEVDFQGRAQFIEAREVAERAYRLFTAYRYAMAHAACTGGEVRDVLDSEGLLDGYPASPEEVREARATLERLSDRWGPMEAPYLVSPPLESYASMCAVLAKFRR